MKIPICYNCDWFNRHTGDQCYKSGSPFKYGGNWVKECPFFDPVPISIEWIAKSIEKGEVDIDQLRLFLKQNGWEEKSRADGVAIIFSKGGKTILIPVNPRSSDFEIKMELALKVLKKSA